MKNIFSCDSTTESSLIYANFTNKGERNLMKKKKEALRISALLCESTWLSCRLVVLRCGGTEEESPASVVLHENGKLVNYPTLHLIITRNNVFEND